jgi:hypothetical protein
MGGVALGLMLESSASVLPGICAELISGRRGFLVGAATGVFGSLLYGTFFELVQVHAGALKLNAGSGITPPFALFAPRSDGATALASRFSVLLEPELRSPFSPLELTLVRPDGYVACSGSNVTVIAD